MVRDERILAHLTAWILFVLVTVPLWMLGVHQCIAMLIAAVAVPYPAVRLAQWVLK